MNYKEINKDLFEMPRCCTLVHCISKDCAMGKGIAKIFAKEIPLMKNDIRNIIKGQNLTGSFAIYYRGSHLEYDVINLVTKERYWQKPTYKSLKAALEDCKEICIKRNIKKLAMPKIGSGLDRLKWDKVRDIIQEVFGDMDIEIVVCYL